MRGYLCRKAYDMADFIQDSIGYEGGKVHSFFATDEVSSVLLSSQIVSDLIVKWNTTSLCLSLYCMKDVIIRQLPKDSNHAKAYVFGTHAARRTFVVHALEQGSHRRWS